jgi:excisionase family DNA binding protein
VNGVHQQEQMTLHEAADLLGVHYMTAYRYVRLGQLPAAKVSGTWRVQRADVEAVRDPESPPQVQPRKRVPWSERLEQRLIAGDGSGAWGVVEAAMAAGSELHEIYLDVLSPAMASIGQRWARGEIDISVEHRASGIAMRIIGRMGPRFNRRGRSKGTVIVGAPAGERHNLPVAMVADLVRQGGWEVSDLGVDTPAGSFVHAAGDTDDLVAVGISVTTPECLDAAVEALAGLRTAFGPDLLLFVGGRAVADMDHAKTLGANGWAADGVGLVALLEHQTRKRSRSRGEHDEVDVND